MNNTLLRNGTIIGQSNLMRLSSNAGKVCPVQEWQIDGFRDIAARLNDRAFPCLFARHAWKSKTLLFGLISEGNTAADMLAVMQRFTERTQKAPVEERLYSPLVLIFERAGLDSLDEAQRFAWQQLQRLHDYDTHAWPDNIPDDPEESAWSFCFAGVELFFNVSGPAYSRLRSRNLGKRAVFIVNPRAHFDILASQKDSKGIKIRETIRTRVWRYNDGYVPSELGFYGQEDSLEWKQYLLNEPGTPHLARCPLHIHKDKSSK
ncbi:YqcI/YcgG family protein [Lonsdalea quercina]|uniref:YqcI/YcgG family protein n=1 Tax=Lonsdalea quercina TaxID=71657 RepID=UPI0039771B92